MLVKGKILLMDLLLGSQLRKYLIIQMLILVEVSLLTTVPCHKQVMLKLESMVSSMQGQKRKCVVISSLWHLIGIMLTKVLIGQRTEIKSFGGNVPVMLPIALKCNMYLKRYEK